jgi:hypothetical protein
LLIVSDYKGCRWGNLNFKLELGSWNQGQIWNKVEEKIDGVAGKGTRTNLQSQHDRKINKRTTNKK